MKHIYLASVSNEIPRAQTVLNLVKIGLPAILSCWQGLIEAPPKNSGTEPFPTYVPNVHRYLSTEFEPPHRLSKEAQYL